MELQSGTRGFICINLNLTNNLPALDSSYFIPRFSYKQVQDDRHTVKQRTETYADKDTVANRHKQINI